jgi:hypothetical protein
MYGAWVIEIELLGCQEEQCTGTSLNFAEKTYGT